METFPLTDIRQGVDFYEEVMRFEVALIKRALAETGGQQRRAARLLGLKATTLNAKIKQYRIEGARRRGEARRRAVVEASAPASAESAAGL
ncbi:MAG TPA: helix-turn-helix domain-containing protein [Pyrinomonadaceae bacterium]|nr:helix-turn-helix domain-containing protein [Pyrinomonadaceae bacterium]